MDYILKRSDRKTLAAYITDGATLEVRAPLKMPKSDIDRFLASKETWISKHLAVKAEQNRYRASFCLNYNDKILLRGKEYPIKAKEGSKVGFDGVCFYMPDGYDSGRIMKTVIRIYKSLASKLLTDKTTAYADVMSVRPSSVKINSAKTRWGSCGGNNSINYSWRIVLADDDVIDYVVVHELAHIRHRDHSERFWTEVASFMPDYNLRRQRLKELQKRLGTEMWD